MVSSKPVAHIDERRFRDLAQLRLLKTERSLLCVLSRLFLTPHLGPQRKSLDKGLYELVVDLEAQLIEGMDDHPGVVKGAIWRSFLFLYVLGDWGSGS